MFLAALLAQTGGLPVSPRPCSILSPYIANTFSVNITIIYSKSAGFSFRIEHGDINFGQSRMPSVRSGK